MQFFPPLRCFAASRKLFQGAVKLRVFYFHMDWTEKLYPQEENILIIYAKESERNHRWNSQRWSRWLWHCYRKVIKYFQLFVLLVVQYLPLSKGSDRYVMDRACCFTCNNFSFSKTSLYYHITFISSELIFFMKNYLRFP